jgi:hypothetical protein
MQIALFWPKLLPALFQEASISLPFCNQFSQMVGVFNDKNIAKRFDTVQNKQTNVYI